MIFQKRADDINTQCHLVIMSSWSSSYPQRRRMMAECRIVIVKNNHYTIIIYSRPQLQPKYLRVRIVRQCWRKQVWVSRRRRLHHHCPTFEISSPLSSNYLSWSWLPLSCHLGRADQFCIHQHLRIMIMIVIEMKGDSTCLHTSHPRLDHWDDSTSLWLSYLQIRGWIMKIKIIIWSRLWNKWHDMFIIISWPRWQRPSFHWEASPPRFVPE